MILEDTLRYMLGRLIIVQIFIDSFLQFRMLNNGIGADAIIFLSDITFVLGVFSVVPPSDASLL